MIQFFHQMLGDPSSKKKFTVAVDPPTKEQLKEILLLDNKEIFLSVGSAICSNKDSYCRRVGREISNKRRILTIYRLFSVDFEGDRTFYLFLRSDNKFALRFRVNQKSSRVYLVEAAGEPNA